MDEIINFFGIDYRFIIQAMTTCNKKLGFLKWTPKDTDSQFLSKHKTPKLVRKSANILGTNTLEHIKEEVSESTEALNV